MFSSTPECLSSFLLQICPCEVQLSTVPQQCSLDIDEHDPCADPRSCDGARARFTPCSMNVMPVTSEAGVCTRVKPLQPCTIHAASLAFALLYLIGFLGVKMGYTVLKGMAFLQR